MYVCSTYYVYSLLSSMRLVLVLIIKILNLFNTVYRCTVHNINLIQMYTMQCRGWFNVYLYSELPFHPWINLSWGRWKNSVWKSGWYKPTTCSGLHKNLCFFLLFLIKSFLYWFKHLSFQCKVEQKENYLLFGTGKKKLFY